MQETMVCLCFGGAVCRMLSTPGILMSSSLLTPSCLMFEASALRGWHPQSPRDPVLPENGSRFVSQVQHTCIPSHTLAWAGLPLRFSQFLCPNFLHPMCCVPKPLPTKGLGPTLWGPRFSGFLPFLLRRLVDSKSLVTIRANIYLHVTFSKERV